MTNSNHDRERLPVASPQAGRVRAAALPTLPKRQAAARPLRVLDLFSGIGGFSLGLERAGMQTVAFCEIEPYCQAVLRKHWPDVPIYSDIRTLTGDTLGRDGIAVDVICGGFPCQDISLAGTGAGIEGERSGLWREYARLICELRPRFVIVENVAALLGRGLSRVLGDLAALGYDAEWHCIPASYVGAPHRRDRLWIVAYPAQEHDSRGSDDGHRGEHNKPPRQPGRNRLPTADTNANSEVTKGRPGRPGWWGGRAPDIGGHFWRGRHEGTYQWPREPNVGRVANGVSNAVDRLGALGNSVVPQIPEMIGRAIVAATYRPFLQPKVE